MQAAAGFSAPRGHATGVAEDEAEFARGRVEFKGLPFLDGKAHVGHFFFVEQAAEFFLNQAEGVPASGRIHSWRKDRADDERVGASEHDLPGIEARDHDLDDDDGMNEVDLAVLVDKGEGVFLAADEGFDLGKGEGVGGVSSGHEDVIHPVADEGHDVVEEVGDAGVVGVEFEDEVVLQQVHVGAAGQGQAHVEVLAGSVSVHDGSAESALEQGFDVWKQGFAAISDLLRVNAEVATLLGFGEEFEDGGVAGEVTGLECVQLGDDGGQGPADIEGADVVEEAVAAGVAGEHEAGAGEVAAGGGDEGGAAAPAEGSHAGGMAGALDPGFLGKNEVTDGAGGAGGVQDVVAAVQEIRRIRGGGKEGGHALPGKAAIRDQVVEVEGDISLGEDGEISGYAGRGVDAVLLDDAAVVRRALLDKGDEAAEFADLSGLQFGPGEAQVSAVFPEGAQPEIGLARGEKEHGGE